MSKSKYGQSAKAKFHKDTAIPPEELLPVVSRVKKEPLEAKTQKQAEYINAINTSIITFGTGPAGTGKSYVSVAMAADMLRDKTIEKILLTRPAVEAGESFGFLPGTLEEKYAEYINPVREILEERLGKSWVENLIKLGKIEGAPLGFMRGRTFKDCVVILDEAQNCTPAQMELFLTRIGENCTVVINGDTSQRDIRGMSGLVDAIERISWIPQVSVIKFEKKDIVRSGICQEIVESYEK